MKRRHDLWLDLLTRFTATSEQWLVWKNACSALHGNGDVDSAAPADDWAALRAEFDRWVRRYHLEPATACTHVPGGLNLMAFPAGERTFLEVSIKASKSFRGARLFDIEQLLPLAEMDEEGFRRLRPGAEGVLKLLLNGTAWRGREDAAGLRAKNVRALLVQDPQGALQAASLAGDSKPALLRLAVAVSGGGWDASAARHVERHFVRKAAADPSVLARRVFFRATAQRRCSVVEAILSGGRRIPEDREAWLARVARAHTIDETNWERATGGAETQPDGVV